MEKLDITWNGGFIVLSYLLSVQASYTAVMMVQMNSLPMKIYSAFILAVSGIWSMHFVGMAAFSIPVDITFDIGWTIASAIFAFVCTAAAMLLLHFVYRHRNLQMEEYPNTVSGNIKALKAAPHLFILLAAAIIALGVSAMHYTGMHAMSSQATAKYEWGIIFASVAIAYAAGWAALQFMLVLPLTRLFSLPTAIVMGIAVCGMHYSGMYGISYHIDPSKKVSGSNAIEGIAIYICYASAVLSSSAIPIALFVAKRALGGAPTEPPLALIFTDIESSTHLWEKFGDTMAEAVSRHHAIIRNCILTFGCYEVKTVGDAFMIACPSTIVAAKLCVAMQRELHNADWPGAILHMAYDDDDANSDGGNEPEQSSRENRDSKKEEMMTVVSHAAAEEENKNLPPSSGFRGLRVRMGMHHCVEVDAQFDPVYQRYDYYGPDVNLTARVQSKAAGGQVLMTGDTAAILMSEPQYEEGGEGEILNGISLRPFATGVTLKGVEGTATLFSMVPSELTSRQFPPILGALPPAATGMTGDMESMSIVAPGEEELTSRAGGTTSQTGSKGTSQSLVTGLSSHIHTHNNPRLSSAASSSQEHPTSLLDPHQQQQQHQQSSSTAAHQLFSTVCNMLPSAAEQDRFLDMLLKDKGLKRGGNISAKINRLSRVLYAQEEISHHRHSQQQQQHAIRNRGSTARSSLQQPSLCDDFAIVEELGSKHPSFLMEASGSGSAVGSGGGPIQRHHRSSKFLQQQQQPQHHQGSSREETRSFIPPGEVGANNEDDEDDDRVPMRAGQPIKGRPLSATQRGPN